VGDLALVTAFFSMLMIPCIVATRSVRGPKAMRPAGVGAGTTAETYDDPKVTAAQTTKTSDRQSLALQRSRELYHRHGTQVRSLPDYVPVPRQLRERIPRPTRRSSSSPFISAGRYVCVFDADGVVRLSPGSNGTNQ
jgi:hypothetical protein